MATPLRDITGQRFHRLVALEFAGYKQYATERKRMWKCRCDCGKEVIVAYMYLTGGGTKSCGCLVGQHKRTHGATVGGKGTPEFRAWDAMRRRCNNPTDANYFRYGGRGIRVCERWMASFADFLADMGPRPSPAHSIDRRNNDGNYDPGNCRWATDGEQSNNRRSSLQVTLHGKTKTAAQWERDLGFKPGLISKRLAMGWTVERTLTAPSSRHSRAAD